MNIKKNEKNYKQISNIGLKSFKSTFAYFVNPFICDIIEDGFLISEIILTEIGIRDERGSIIANIAQSFYD